MVKRLASLRLERLNFKNIALKVKGQRLKQLGARLTVRAALFTILTCVIPLAIVGWYFITQTMDALTVAAIDRNNKVAERVASDIGGYVQSKKNFLLVTSGEGAIRSMQPEAMRQYLSTVKPYYGNGDALFVARADGQQIVRTDNGETVNIVDREYFKQAMQGVPQFSSPVQSKVTKQLTILGTAPVYGPENKVVGVVGANLSVQSLHTMIEQVISQNPGYAVTLLDKNKIPVFYQMDSSAVEERKQLTDDYYEQAIAEQTGNTKAIIRGQDFLLSYRPVANTDWIVISAYPRQAALQSAFDMVEQSMAVMTVIVTIFVLAGLYAARRSLIPLNYLVAGSQKVAAGDLTYQLDTGREDEFGHVAKAFNSMTASLRQIVDSVKESSKMVQTASGSVAAASEQSRFGSAQVSQSVARIAEQLVEQSKDTAATEQHLHQLVNITTDVSENIKRAATASDECSVLADEGQTVINRTVDSMYNIKTLVDKTSQTVLTLNKSANEISQITGIITGIAKQTSLLALNAAIEAARAGESGRGFAVVADEVRKLSEESAVAAKSIAGIVTRIQDETGGVVAAMEESAEHVKQGVEVAKTSGSAFAKINDAIISVQNQANTIARQTGEQDELCKKAIEAITKISDMAGNNTSSAQEIAAVCQQQAASSHDITYATEKLKTMACELEGLVAKFKI